MKSSIQKNIVRSIRQTFVVASMVMGASSSYAAPVAVAPLSNEPGQEQIFTALLVAPRADKLDNRQKASLTAIQDIVTKKAQETFPVILTQMGMAMTANNGVKTVFVDTASALKEAVGPMLAEINSKLPDDPLYFTVYVLPWKKDAQTAKMTENNPLFSYLQVSAVDWAGYKTAADFYYQVNRVVREAIDRTDESAFTLLGASFQIRVQKNRNAIQAQVLGVVNPQEREFIQKNDQVDLKLLSFREKGQEKLERPVAILNINHELFKEKGEDEKIPKITIDLGSYGGVSGGLGGWLGQFQVYKEFDIATAHTDALEKQKLCRAKFNYVPTLIGKLGPAATSNKYVNKIIGALQPDVKFRISEISLNPRELKIDRMTVHTQIANLKIGGVALLQCLAMSDVESQFTNEANLAIQASVESLYKQDDITDELMNELYN